MRVTALAAVAGIVVAAYLATAPPATAETCAAHLIRAGTTVQADRAYHAAHGGESPCEDDSGRYDGGDSGDSGTGGGYHRDRVGVHCGWRGCG